MSFRITPLNDESECESESESDAEPHENTEEIEETEGTESQQGKENVTVGKLKTVPPPHKKRKVIRSNVQTLSSLAGGLKELAESQMKIHKLTLQHEKERDDNYLKFREEEARKTRKHEYRMACLFAGSNPTNRAHTNIQSTPEVSSACSYGPEITLKE